MEPPEIPECAGPLGAMGLGVDQENAKDCVLLEVFCIGCDVIIAGAASHAESIGLAFAPPPAFPFTRLSKSISPLSAVLLDAKAFGAPNDMKSSSPLALDPLMPDSSESFLVCSDSTRVDKLLIRSMKDWNCLRSSNGPKLMPHNTGRISIATNSSSATAPTCRRTFKAAMATAGSFVLIPLMRGRIFSCIVYLSRAVELLFLLAFMMPSRPSLLPAGSAEPPQRITNASSPRTLMPRLLVLLKTEAITGNRSFFMVEKSSTGRITGRLRREASTILCVGDSMARRIMGRISVVRLGI